MNINFAGNTSIEDCELLILSDYPRDFDFNVGHVLSEVEYQFFWDILNKLGVRYLVYPLFKLPPKSKAGKEAHNNIYTDEVNRVLQAPKLRGLLLLGQNAVEYFYPGKKIANLRNELHYLDTAHGRIKVMATYHPSFIIKSDNENYYNRFIDDIVDISRETFRYRASNNYVVETITAQAFAQLADQWLADPTVQVIGFDTESNGLNPWIDGFKITSFSVAKDTSKAYNIILYHPELPDITEQDRKLVRDKAEALLTSKQVVSHHAKHEHKVCKHFWRFTPNIVDDTMYMAYTLYMDYPGVRYGLDYLAGMYAHMPAWEDELGQYSKLFKELNSRKTLSDTRMNTLLTKYENLHVTENELKRFFKILSDPDYYIKQADSDNSDPFYWLVPLKVLEAYAGMDAIAPLELMKIFKPQILSDPGLTQVYQQLIKAAEVFANIELKGLRICDLEEWTVVYQKEVDKALDDIRSFKEVQEFEKEQQDTYNPNSSQQNAVVLFEKMGYPVQERTSTGVPSASESNLIALAELYQAKDPKTEDDEYKLKFLSLFRRYKKLDKILQTYFIGLQKHMGYNNAFDGITCEPLPVPAGEQDIHIHPQYKLHGTKTGRLSSQDPSLHTIPGKSESKMMFSPHDRGRGGLMLMADYAACELRVLASICEKYYGDPNMANAFRQGMDLHRYVASNAFLKPMDEITDLERKYAKSISFAVVYGSSVKSVADAIHHTEQQTQVFFDNFFANFPGTQRYIDNMHSYASTYGCVRYPNGRIRHLPAALNPQDGANYSAAMRRSQNSCIQGTASDIAVLAIIEFDRLARLQGIKSKVVGTVHDSIYVDVYPGELLECIKLLKYVMTEYPQQVYDFLTCPMGADFEVSTSLGLPLSVEEFLPEQNLIRLKGRDYLQDEVEQELRLAYQVDKELLSEELQETETIDLHLQTGVISLTNSGTFNIQERRYLLNKR